MKVFIIFIMSVVFGGLLVIGYYFVNKPKVQTTPTTQTKKDTTTFSIEPPPSNSLKGMITAHTGDLLWESRIATDPVALGDNTRIQQGERLITQDKSNATVNFEKVGTLTFFEDTDVSFIQTLPVDFVVEQKKGTVEYILNGTTPLSIRMRSALITKESGTVKITMKDDDSIITISTVEGTAQIGFNDTDGVSQVFTLREDQIYEYNSDERTAINTNNK